MATIALFTRQALLVSYIVLGTLLGPSALGIVNDANLVRELSHIGIIFLLFLMGLDLNPKESIVVVQKNNPSHRRQLWVVCFSGGGHCLCFWFFNTNQPHCGRCHDVLQHHHGT